MHLDLPNDACKRVAQTVELEAALRARVEVVHLPVMPPAFVEDTVIIGLNAACEIQEECPLHIPCELSCQQLSDHDFHSYECNPSLTHLKTE